MYLVNIIVCRHKSRTKMIYCLFVFICHNYFQLALKTVNGARSAFASFHFKRSFFHSYRDGVRGGRDEEEPLKCKISIKVSEAVKLVFISQWFGTCTSK